MNREYLNMINNSKSFLYCISYEFMKSFKKLEPLFKKFYITLYEYMFKKSQNFRLNYT